MTTRHRRSTAALLASALVGTAALVLGAPSHASSTWHDLTGSWRTSGYGQVITVTPPRDDGRRRLVVFETTAISCVRADTVPEVAASAGGAAFGSAGTREVVVRPAGDELRLRWLGTAADVRLTRFAGTFRCPERDALTPPERRLHTFDVFWQTLTEHYPAYPGRPLDWDLRKRDRATLQSDNTGRTLGRLLRATVRDLGDMHTSVSRRGRSTWGVRPGTRDSWDMDEAAIGSAIEAWLPRPLRPVLGNGVQYATGLPGRVGYLRITRFDDFSTDGAYVEDRKRFARALDQVFQRAQRDGWRGLILDLRLNDGGWDGLGLELVSRLTRRPHPGFSKRARDVGSATGFTPFQRVGITPSGRPGFSGPVALLVSDLTVSAGETTAMALRNRSPRPIVIGRPTQGIFSDVLDRTLPGGWSLELSNEDYRTIGGRSLEGRGIPVSKAYRTSVFAPGHLRDGCDPALALALDVLRSRPLGRTARCPG